MLCSIGTNVNETTLQTLKGLENELGKTLLLFNCHALKPSELTAEQLQKIQETESKLGVSLVAVEY